MAWIEKKGQRFRIAYRFSGVRRVVALKSTNKRDAELCLARFEENLRLVERGRMLVPVGADLGLFLLSDGRLEKHVEITRMPTLKDIITHYQRTFTTGAKEEITRRMEDIHLAHLSRIIGGRRLLSEITSAVIQEFINTRSRESYRGQVVKTKT